MKTWLIALTLSAPTAAHASDCLDAAASIVRGREIALFCESCGDVVPGLPHRAGTSVVDPAHTYVRTSPARFENVALLAGCTTDALSPGLRVEAETDAGVLITPDASPVIAMRPEPPVTGPLPPPPPVAPAPTYYSTTIIYAVPWLAVAAVAGTGGFLLGIVGGILLGARRRRAMKPRAVDLAG